MVGVEQPGLTLFDQRCIGTMDLIQGELAGGSGAPFLWLVLSCIFGLMANPARLFHAVVVVGAALTAPACHAPRDRGGAVPLADEAAPASPAAPDVSASIADASAPVADAEAASADASTPDGGGRADSNPTKAGNPKRCPPGSERPFPPCYYIL